MLTLHDLIRSGVEIIPNYKIPLSPSSKALAHRYFGGTKIVYSGSHMEVADELGELEKQIERAFSSGAHWRDTMLELLQREESTEKPNPGDSAAECCKMLWTEGSWQPTRRPLAVFEVEMVPGHRDSPYQALYTRRDGVRAVYGWVKLDGSMLQELSMRETSVIECQFVPGEVALDVTANLPWMVQHSGRGCSADLCGAWVGARLLQGTSEPWEERAVVEALDTYAAAAGRESNERGAGPSPQREADDCDDHHNCDVREQSRKRDATAAELGRAAEVQELRGITPFDRHYFRMDSNDSWSSLIHESLKDNRLHT